MEDEEEDDDEEMPSKGKPSKKGNKKVTNFK